jgi:predicted GIY-YIG superfamily endonuclease
MYKCYIIYNNNNSYVGMTNNIERRIRQHNQIIKGGAKYTRLIGNGWNYICFIDGFKSKIHALQFEWALKHINKKKGILNRMDNLILLLNKKNWTSKAPCSIDYELTLNICDITFINEKFETHIPNYILINIIL